MKGLQRLLNEVLVSCCSFILRNRKLISVPIELLHRCPKKAVYFVSMLNYVSFTG